MGFVAIILFVFSLVLYYLLNDNISSKIETRLYKKALFVQQNIPKNNLKKLYGVEVAILKNGQIFNQTKRFTLKNYEQYISQNRSFYIKDIDDDTREAIYIYRFTDPFNGAIIVYKKDIENKKEDIQSVLLILNPILLILLIIIGNRLINKILIPIKNITKNAKEISVSNFSHTIKKTKKNDEIGELTDSFNEMILRLQEGTEAMERFNSDISHELRTPLTIIEGELELCLKKDRDIEYYKRGIKSALQETKKLEELVKNILLLSRYTKQNIKETFVPCQIEAILMNAIDSCERKIADKKIDLKIEKLEPMNVSANQFLITSIFANLLENAIKYTPNGKNITISLFRDEKVHFVIKDEGIGIPKEKLSKITQRFYRVDDSRNKKIKGFGLGLSIVQNSIKLHNGTLKIDSEEGKGTQIEVIF